MLLLSLSTSTHYKRDIFPWAQTQHKRNALFEPEHKHIVNVMFPVPDQKKQYKANAFIAPKHKCTMNSMLCFVPEHKNNVHVMFLVHPNTQTT